MNGERKRWKRKRGWGFVQIKKKSAAQQQEGKKSVKKRAVCLEGQNFSPSGARPLASDGLRANEEGGWTCMACGGTGFDCWLCLLSVGEDRIPDYQHD